ncbi:MAG: XdhC family protein [Thermomicrobiales bacterium]
MSEAERSTTYERLKAAIESWKPAAAATIVRGEPLGAKILVIDGQSDGTFGDAALDRLVVAEAKRWLGESISTTTTIPGPRGEIEVFFESFPPPPSLLIFGAVHVAQPLTTMGKMLGFRVVVIDVRAKLATRDRFPDADEIVLEWPDAALEGRTVDRNTAIAILSHDPKFDEPALLGALATPARYIGAVGSRKTNVDRRQRLEEAGVDDESISRIRGPIGLNIGASTPEEMAISILAEIIAVWNDREGGPLATATGNIRPRV